MAEFCFNPSNRICGFLSRVYKASRRKYVNATNSYKSKKSTVYVSKIPFLHVSNMHKHLGQRVLLDISVLRPKGLYNNDSRLSDPVN